MGMSSRWSKSTRARNLNMADVPKVSVDSNEAVLELHKKLKEVIERKLKEKDWTEDKREEFKGRILKLYEETVELALKENLVVKHEDNSSDVIIQQEMEPVNKERVMEVNKMCATSEELLTCTIRKRKHYPQKIKEFLQKRLNNLVIFDSDKMDLVENRVDSHGESSTFNEEQSDMSECETYLTRFKKDSEKLVLLSKPLPERKEKAQRLQTATEMNLRMQDNDVYKALVGKRKSTSTIDSILAMPSKENTNHSFNEPEVTVTSTSQFIDIICPLKKLRYAPSKDSLDQT